MNIAIINIDNNPQYIGGIKRVSSILGNEWIRLGHNVCFLTFCTDPVLTNDVSGLSQFFLPNTSSICNEDNINYVKLLLEENEIDCLIQQHAEEYAMTDLCCRSITESERKIIFIGAYHFDPLFHIKEIRTSFFNSYKNYNIFFEVCRKIRFELFDRYRLVNEQTVLISATAQKVDKFVFLSEKFRKSVNRLCTACNDDKLFFINNPSRANSTSNLSSKEKTVVWCGRVEFGMKRIDLMMRIWEKINKTNPDWNLVVLGSGNIDYFRSIASKKKISNIEFNGFCNPTEYYEKASIVCMTSVAEGWGMTLIEGMSYGCVPMAFNSYESLSDIIDNEINGYMISAFNIEEYTTKLSILMNDEESRKSMAIKAKDSVAKFEDRKIAQQWINIIENTLI